MKCRFLFTLLLVSIALVGVAGPGKLLLPVADDPPQYSPWSAPVNLGPIVNSSANDAGAFISKDGLSLYFGSTRPGGYGVIDIYVSQRASRDAPWEPPQNLGPTINTSCSEQTPTLSVDGHWLYFARDCGGFGGQDLFVSRRHNKRDDFGWQLPVNLGSGVNSTANESCPALFEDDESGIITLYFNSDRLLKSYEDIYVSMLQEDETFGPAVLVEELNDPDPKIRDVRPSIWKDGLMMFLDSNRLGTLGGQDLFFSTRGSTSEPWSTPGSLGPVVNSTVLDARPVLSFDGTELYFHSNRSGGWGSNDLYRSTRTKLKGPE
jgi:hypothetical protein